MCPEACTLVQGDGTIMGGILVMRPVTNEVEYMFPENEFGTYPDIEEVGASYTFQSCTL